MTREEFNSLIEIETTMRPNELEDNRVRLYLSPVDK